MLCKIDHTHEIVIKLPTITSRKTTLSLLTGSDNTLPPLVLLPTALTVTLLIAELIRRFNMTASKHSDILSGLQQAFMNFLLSDLVFILETLWRSIIQRPILLLLLHFCIQRFFSIGLLKGVVVRRQHQRFWLLLIGDSRSYWEPFIGSTVKYSGNISFEVILIFLI